MAQPLIQPSFNAGELAPDLWGNVALSLYHRGASTARNVFVNYRGGLYSRAGTAFIGRCLQDISEPPPRDIPFVFSVPESLVLEFGTSYMRIKHEGAYVLEPAENITLATQSNPCVLEIPGQTYSAGDWVYLTGITGMTQLNGRTVLVASSDIGAGTITLDDLDGNPLSSTTFSVYTGGGTAARVYTLTTPYDAADLPFLKFAQSADVMTLTCVNVLTSTEYPPYELKRFGTTNWTLTALNPSADISPPTGIGATVSNNPDPGSSPPTQPCAYAYVVTAVNLTTGSESNASGRVNITNSVDMGVTAGSITTTWDPVAGAGKYNIYRTAPAYNTDTGSTSDALPVPAGALFFYAGTSYGNEFVDTNVVTDSTKVPPKHENPFARGQAIAITMTASSSDWTSASVAISTSTGSGFTGECVIVGGAIVAVIIDNAGANYTDGDTVSFSGDGTSASGMLTLSSSSGTYPAVVAYFQQRQFFAQTLNAPDTFWASQDGLFTNFDAGDPPSDTDAITASPFSQVVNGIQWLVPMPGGLVILSGTSAWQLAGTGGSALNPQPITPTSEQVQPQAFNGISAILPPIRINYDILFGDGVGSLIYSLNYNIYFNIYNAAEVSWQSAHLFDGHFLNQWAWCRSPSRIIWGARDDGILLSLTWVKEEEVAGWTRHDTQGFVHGVCSISEPPVDALYLIVERYLQGRWVYIAERMDNRIWQSVENCWCVDSGLSTLSGYDYPAIVVSASSSSGAVTFTAASAVFQPFHVGEVMRLGGGIATITGYTSSTVITGVWTRPAITSIPNAPAGLPPFRAAAGTWSLLPQVTSVSNLDHLEGAQVVGLADGIPVGPFTVSGGAVTLPFAASLVTIGLAFLPQFQSLYMAGEQPTEQGRRKAINAITARVAASGMPMAAANETDGSATDPMTIAPTWTGMKQLAPTPPGSSPATYQNAAGQTVTPLYTGDLRVNIPTAWRKPGQVAIEQPLPLPLNLTAIVPEDLTGDVPDLAVPPRERPGAQGARQR